MKKIRTLLVDDEPRFLTKLVAFLQTHDRIEVLGQVSDGSEAVKYVSDHTVDLVLMDIQMESMNGVEAARQIKKINPMIRVVMLTVFSDHEYQIQAIRHGADAYVVKKEMFEELLPAIDLILPDYETHPDG